MGFIVYFYIPKPWAIMEARYYEERWQKSTVTSSTEKESAKTAALSTEKIRTENS